MVTHSQSAARWRQLSESMCTGGCLAGRLWVPRWQVGCLAGWLPEGCTGHVRRRSSPQSSLRAWSSTAIVKSTSALVQHMGGLMRKTLPARPAAAAAVCRAIYEAIWLPSGGRRRPSSSMQRWLARQGRHAGRAGSRSGRGSSRRGWPMRAGRAVPAHLPCPAAGPGPCSAQTPAPPQQWRTPAGSTGSTARHTAQLKRQITAHPAERSPG